MATTRDPIDKLSYVTNEAHILYERDSSTVLQASSATATESHNVSPELEKKLMRKIDFWLVGFYSIVYIFRVIDSADYSKTAIINLEAGTGIKKQLGFTPSQWAWTLSIFSHNFF